MSRSSIIYRHIIVLVVVLFCISIAFNPDSLIWYCVDALIALIWIAIITINCVQVCKANTVYFSATTRGAIIPTKNMEDAGYDIYANFEEDYIVIDPGETKLIPTGLSSAFSSDYMAVLKERGSTGTKGIGQRCGIIDSGYRGEWFVPITNHNLDKSIVILRDDKERSTFDVEKYIIYPYSKAICQALFLPVPKLKMCSISKTVFVNKFMNTTRGIGMLGSSGK